MADDKKSLSARLRVKPGERFKLAKQDTRGEDLFTGKDAKEKVKAATAEDAAAIDQLQDRLFAEAKRSLLVVLQGIDCSGKDVISPEDSAAIFPDTFSVGQRVARFLQLRQCPENRLGSFDVQNSDARFRLSQCLGDSDTENRVLEHRFDSQGSA